MQVMDGETGRLAYEQSQLSVPSDRIDREAGILRRVHLQGPVSKHGYRYDLDAMRRAAPRFEQMTVGIDHDYESKPLKVREGWGTVQSPVVVDADGIWGDLAYLKRHEQTETILEAAERNLINVGLSAVTRIRREQNGVVMDYDPARLDVVVGAATTKSFFEQETPMAEPEPKPEMTAEDHSAAALHSALDAVLKEDTDGHEKAKKMAKMIKAIHSGSEEPSDVKSEKAEAKEEKKEAESGKSDTPDEWKQEQAKLSAKLMTMEQRFEQVIAKNVDLEKRLVLREQYVAPSTSLQQTIAATVDKIDLKAFWNDK